MIFNEDSRVKIPCILHLLRLGYQYLSLKNVTWDEDVNIFPDIFRSAIARINHGIAVDDINRLLQDIKLSLDNEDLGKAFFEKLTARSGIKLIDFSNFSRNRFHVVTELTCRPYMPPRSLSDLMNRDAKWGFLSEFLRKLPPISL